MANEKVPFATDHGCLGGILNGTAAAASQAYMFCCCANAAIYSVLTDQLWSAFTALFKN